MVVAGYVFLIVSMFLLFVLGTTDFTKSKRKVLLLGLFFVFFAVAISLIVASELISI